MFSRTTNVRPFSVNWDLFRIPPKTGFFKLALPVNGSLRLLPEAFLLKKPDAILDQLQGSACISTSFAAVRIA